MGGYEGTEASTGVSWWIRRNPFVGWQARRDNERKPSIFGRTLKEISEKLRKE
jgi:hypothetical protein